MTSSSGTHLPAPLKHVIIPAGFYLLGFGALTWPLILKFNTHFFTDAGDGLQNVWNLWWVNLALRHPGIYPSIWYTPLLHWPFGTSLVGQTLNPFNGYVAAILMAVASPMVAHNTIVVSAFVLGGLTTYWLAFYLTKSFWGGILAGFLFTFSNFHFMHAQGHLQLVSLEWIPLFILCWVVLITRPGTLSAVGAAVSLWLVILCDYYYFFYCILTAILIVLWYAITAKDPGFFVRREYRAALSTFTVIAVALVAPIVGTLLITNASDPLTGAHQADAFSLDLLALVIPGGHWLFNQWTQFYWSRLPGNIHESSVYLALPVFFLMGYAWIKRKTLPLADRQQVALWSILLFFFWVFALGPGLRVAGQVIWDKAMPYTLLVTALPFLGLSGVPVRMTVMVALSASILSAIGFDLLLAHSSGRKLLIAALLGVLLIETLPRPLPATRIEVPAYVTALARLRNDGGVADLAASSPFLALYYQTIHGKPIVGGYVSRLPSSVLQKDAALDKAISDEDYAQLWGTYHVRYLVVDHDIQSQKSPAYIIVRQVFKGEDVRIYRIECTCEAGP